MTPDELDKIEKKKRYSTRQTYEYAKEDLDVIKNDIVWYFENYCPHTTPNNNLPNYNELCEEINDFISGDDCFDDVLVSNSFLRGLCPKEIKKSTKRKKIVEAVQSFLKHKKAENADSCKYDPETQVKQQDKIIDKLISAQHLRDIKLCTSKLAKELDEFSVHRVNKIKRVSTLYIEPKLFSSIISQRYDFDSSLDFQIYEYYTTRNPKAIKRNLYKSDGDYRKLYDMLNEHDRLIVLGQPGSGKTTILKKIVIDIAAGHGINAYPVYVPLRHFSLKSKSVLQFIQDQFEYVGNRRTGIDMRELLSKGILILLFDGLDEINLSDRERILDELNQITIDFPLNKVVATSRTSNYKGELINFKESEICEFSIDDTILFVNNWFQDNPRKDSLLDKITGYPQIAEIANNPLLLSLICIVYSRNLDISMRRSELYDSCIYCLMVDWDSQRNFRRSSKFQKLDDKKRISLLSYLGYHVHNSGKFYFDINFIEEHLSKIIRKYGLVEDDIATVIKEITDHYGLLIEVSKGEYSFSHLTFQEYFAANYIANTRLFTSHGFNLVSNPFWEEVLILCASILFESTEYLSGILDMEAFSPENIFLAGLCLSVDPVVDVSLKQKIARLILNIYHNSKTIADRERAQYVLAKIDDTFIGKQLLESFGVNKFFIKDQLKGNKKNEEM